MKMVNFVRKIDFTGSRIEKYVFRSRLGRGGFADVYLADEFIGGTALQRVAIKIFVTDLTCKDNFHQTFTLFKRDLSFLVKLGEASPIVRYFNALTPDILVSSDGTITVPPGVPSAKEKEDIAAYTAFLIVMEFADGGSLDGAYRNEVIVNGNDGAHLSHFKDICIGLQAAHDKNIIHRDIKPANLFYFRKANKVKLGDFGIAKELNEELWQQPYFVGSLPYVAPEVLHTNRHTKLSDIYSLGCTFYELFSGKQAFRLSEETIRKCDDWDKLCKASLELHESKDRPNALTDANPYLGIPLNGMISRMISIDPDERPTLKQVIGALEREQEHRTIDIGRAMNRAMKATLRLPPEILSKHNVNPRFRRSLLEELPFFIFIDAQPRTELKIKRLQSLLEECFDHSYSFYEIYGQYDFLVRVWGGADKRRISRFLSELKIHILDGAPEAILVMACEDVRYPGITMPIIPREKKTELLIKLNEVQTKETSERVHNLKHDGIYVRGIVSPATKGRIKCFCLVKSVPEADESDRQAQSVLIRDGIEQADIGEQTRRGLSVYRRAYMQVDGFRNGIFDHLIEYVAPSYKGVIQIPELILTKIPKYRFKTTTYLSSNRYLIESDMVQIPGA